MFYSVLMVGGYGKKGKKITSMSSVVFACHSAACAPPSAGGTGGSIAGKGPKGGRSGSRSGIAGLLEKQMGASGGGNMVRARGVRDELSGKAASAKTVGSAKFHEAAVEGANAMLHPTVTQAYAMKKIKEARMMKRTASEPDRETYHDGWASGAERAARARWG